MKNEINDKGCHACGLSEMELCPPCEKRGRGLQGYEVRVVDIQGAIKERVEIVRDLIFRAVAPRAHREAQLKRIMESESIRKQITESPEWKEFAAAIRANPENQEVQK